MEKDTIFDVITEGLVKVCKTIGAHFHHFRHSFDNRLRMILFVAENEEELRSSLYFLDLMEKLGIEFNSAKQIRVQLLGNCATSQRQLEQVALSMGHATPEMTLQSYLHVEEMIASFFLRRFSPELTRKQTAGLLQCSEKTIDRLFDRYRPDVPVHRWTDMALNDLIEWYSSLHHEGPPPVNVTGFITGNDLRISLPETPEQRIRLWQQAVSCYADNQHHPFLNRLPFPEEQLSPIVTLMKSAPNIWFSRAHKGTKRQKILPELKKRSEFEELSLLAKTSTLIAFIHRRLETSKAKSVPISAEFNQLKNLPNLSIKSHWCDLVITQARQLNGIMMILGDIGVELTEIGFYHQCNSRSDIGRDRQRIYWMNALEQQSARSSLTSHDEASPIEPRVMRGKSLGSMGQLIIRPQEVNYLHRYLLTLGWLLMTTEKK